MTRRSVGHYIAEELKARGWTNMALALRMEGADPREVAVNLLELELIMAVDDPKLVIDDQTARKLGLAFSVAPEFFLNLQRAWQESR